MDGAKPFVMVIPHDGGPPYTPLVPLDTPKKRESKGLYWDGSAILTVVHIVTGIAGAALTFTAIYSLFPMKRSALLLPLVTLKLYMLLFGVASIVLEGKTVLPEHSTLREWLYTEFHFLHASRGKAFFYFLIATLALSATPESLWFLVPGALLTVAAVAYAIASCMDRHWLRNQGIRLKDLQTATQVYPDSQGPIMTPPRRKLRHGGRSSRKFKGYPPAPLSQRPSGYYVRSGDQPVPEITIGYSGDVTSRQPQPQLRPEPLAPQVRTGGRHPALQQPSMVHASYRQVPVDAPAISMPSVNPSSAVHDYMSYTDPLKFTAYLHGR